MAELDRAARTQLVADATALQELASELLTARLAARDAGHSVRQTIAGRAVPLQVPAAREVEPEGSDATSAPEADVRGRILLIRPQDAELLHTELTAQRLDDVPPSFDSWLRHLTDTIPEAIPLASAQGFFRRLFGRGPDLATRERATSDLMHGVSLAKNPQTRQVFERARPVDAHRSPLAPDGLRQAAVPALGVHADDTVVLPTDELRDAALAMRANVQDAGADADLEQRAQIAAEAAINASATALLADIDMDHFRSTVSVGRFPASALERAGIRTVADLLARLNTRFIGVDGIGPDTARTLLIAARQMHAQARDQAKLDLSSGTSSAIDSLRAALKNIIDHKLRSRGADSDRRFSARMDPLAQRIAEETRHHPDTTPFSAGTGHAPALLIGRDKAEAEDLRSALRSVTERRASRYSGQHLGPEESARLAASSADDFTAHGSDYFTLLTELGYEDRIAQNTHGDLPECLVRLVESVELDTELLTLESLRQYQHFAARFIVRQRKVIIGDEMGLGKTIEALAAIAHLTRAGQSHTLVVCPSAVVTNWIREIESKSSISAFRLHGAERDTAAAQWQLNGGVAVTTFETLGRLVRVGDFGRLDTVVVDEAHKIKNPEAKRTQHSVAQLKRASHAILMTGTPIENRLDEFRTLISYLDPSLARSTEGLLPMAFRQHIAPAYLRRNQGDVLKELPELIEIEDWIELSDADRRYYEMQVAAGNFMGMRRAAMEAGPASNKVERLREIVDDATANGRKVIVFSFFRTVIDSLAPLLPGTTIYGPISGAVGAARRQEIIDEFSSAPGGGILLSQIQAGGEGLNIQAASVVVICEPQLKPSLEVQAIARAHRMGQQRSVQVHRLLSDEGTDYRIVELLSEKTKIFNQYARESATKDSDQDATETGDVAIAKRVIADEQVRVLGTSRGSVIEAASP